LPPSYTNIPTQEDQLKITDPDIIKDGVNDEPDEVKVSRSVLKER
jgi:hypothetical protein